ncbi:MAG TPA: GyrI-like domain-containing protein [Gemmatimonadales bacterium]|jgi:hypothetical protein|nr:GyrI-like domain-containing protein [Gemmatimonadales bacterium]
MKLDLYQRFKAEYVAQKAPTLVRVGQARYLTVSGRGDPNGPGFGAAVGALYGIAFTIKMAKQAAKKDYVVAKLEGLWWGGRRGKLLIDSPRSTWRWKLLIRVPTFVGAADLVRARRELVRRGKSGGTVRLEALREGRVIQLLHVGPYTSEQESLGRMAEFARAHHLRLSGRHHEIYLSDPRRVAPAKLRTILRRPVR